MWSAAVLEPALPGRSSGLDRLLAVDADHVALVLVAALARSAAVIRKANAVAHANLEARQLLPGHAMEAVEC